MNTFSYFVILFLGQGLNGGHEDLLVAKQALQNQLGEAVPETGVCVWIQDL